MKQAHKKCKDCDKRQPIKNFYSTVYPNGRWYTASYCKKCSSKRSRTSELKIRAKNYLKLWSYFETHPCVDCGEENPLKLSLDHRDEKNYGITRIMGKHWRRIAAEIELCDTRCHNCHAVKTHASLNHFVTESLRDYVTKFPENKAAYEKYQ